MRNPLNQPSLVLLGALMLASSAHADVTYSIRRLSPGNGISTLPETRVYVTDDAMLEQSWKYGYASLYQEDALSLPTQKKRFIINRNLNIAKVESLAENWEVPRSWGIPTGWNIPQKDGVQLRAVEVAQETVFGFKTRHFRLEQLNKAKVPFRRNDIWVASELDYWPLSYPQTSPQDTPSSRFLKWSSAGLIVRSESWRGSPIMEKVWAWEVGSFAHLRMESSFYSVPKGAKILSADAYTQALKAWNKRILSDKSRKPMLRVTT